MNASRGLTRPPPDFVGNHWDGLCAFLSDARAEMDGNGKDVIRPLALIRKNALFDGRKQGAAATNRPSAGTGESESVKSHACPEVTLESTADDRPTADFGAFLRFAHTTASR